MKPYENISKTKALIIDILLNEFPLSNNEIHQRINKDYYTIYDSVQTLLKQGILLKREKKYSINPDWIKNMNNFISNLRNKYKPLRKGFHTDSV